MNDKTAASSIVGFGWFFPGMGLSTVIAGGGGLSSIGPLAIARGVTSGASSSLGVSWLIPGKASESILAPLSGSEVVDGIELAVDV